MEQRLVYLNGEFVPEDEAKVSIFDRGFNAGDGIYEATRTFNHKLFRLDEHLDRLFRSLSYVRIDCGLDLAAMERATEEVVARNMHLLGAGDDYTVWHVITRGERLPSTNRGATVVIFAKPVEFHRFARHYIDGIVLVTPATRRIPPQCLEAKAKITNKMNHTMAAFEARQADPNAVPLMLDLDGNITETDTTNFFFISRGRLCTPTERNVLGGITRQALFELAAGLGIEVVEGDFTPYDVYTADEAFLSGTSGCIQPVRSLNGAAVGGADVGGDLPGPVTMRLIHAWNEMIGYDYIDQALGHLGDNEAKDLLAAWQKRLAA